MAIDFEKGICAICKKNQVEHWCDFVMNYYNPGMMTIRSYPLFEKMNNQNLYSTCDLPMCNECANEVSNDRHLCEHHHLLMQQAELPNEYQRNRARIERGKAEYVNN